MVGPAKLPACVIQYELICFSWIIIIPMLYVEKSLTASIYESLKLLPCVSLKLANFWKIFITEIVEEKVLC